MNKISDKNKEYPIEMCQTYMMNRCGDKVHITYFLIGDKDNSLTKLKTKYPYDSGIRVKLDSQEIYVPITYYIKPNIRFENFQWNDFDFDKVTDFKDCTGVLILAIIGEKENKQIRKVLNSKECKCIDIILNKKLILHCQLPLPKG